jgi:hypothetical protein
MLENKSDRTQLESRCSQVGVILHRQEDESRPGKGILQSLGRLKAIQQRHADIENNYVWIESGRLCNQLPAIFDDPDYIAGRLKQSADSLGHNAVVIGNQDTGT